MNTVKIKKYFENFWYHYKTYVKIGLLTGTLLLIWAVQSCADIFISNRMKRHDIVILIASKNDVITLADTEMFKNAVANYTEDFNRDKKITVGAATVYKYQNVSAEIEYRNTFLSDEIAGALRSELIKDESFIFFLDDKTLDILIDSGDLADLSVLFPEFIEWEETYGILYDEFNFRNNFADEDLEYYIAFRVYSEESAKKKRYRTRYEQSETVMRNILTDYIYY